MLSRPQTTLLAFLAVSSFAQASWFDEALDEIIKRQDDTAVIVSSSTDGATLISPSTITPSSTTSSPPTVITETSTTSSPPMTTPPVSVSSTTTTSPVPPISEPSPTTIPLETSTTTSPPSSTTTFSSTSEAVVETPTPTTSSQERDQGPSTTAPVTTPSPTVIRVTRTETVNGQVLTSVSEFTSTIQPTSTNAAELNKGKEQSGSSMSPRTRGTIIGVVVGIGGAVLLGGLAVVAYRIWGRKKSSQEGDEFMDYSRPDTGVEKAGGSSAGGSVNPFQSTLESYHNPAKLNASSNF